MSSPFSSMHAAAAITPVLIIDPHVATAIWAIVLAIACALVIFIAEMAKKRTAGPGAARRDRNKPPPR